MKVYIRIEKIIKFGDIKIEKQKFHQHKEPISIKNVDINKITVSCKVSFDKKGFNYFIGYEHANNIRPLSIILQKMKSYRKDFDETKFMSFLIRNIELWEKYNEIWGKVKDSLKKEFDSEPVYNENIHKLK